ncbi:MAG: hypothetical protein Ct9H300mP25_15110 [Acidobacteriota bacterium]|nr:MAG: hypothetical protein Ct9H300mP25_15110 [Acidobacteriota bacterium]
MNCTKCSRTWVLNDDLSDALPPRAEMSKGNRGRRGGGFFRTRWWLWWSGGGGLGGRRGGFGGRQAVVFHQRTVRFRRAGLQEAIKDLTTAPRRMTIDGIPEAIVFNV